MNQSKLTMVSCNSTLPYAVVYMVKMQSWRPHSLNKSDLISDTDLLWIKECFLFTINVYFHQVVSKTFWKIKSDKRKWLFTLTCTLYLISIQLFCWENQYIRRENSPCLWKWHDGVKYFKTEKTHSIQMSTYILISSRELVIK